MRALWPHSWSIPPTASSYAGTQLCSIRPPVSLQQPVLPCHCSVLPYLGLRGQLPGEGWTLPTSLETLDLFDNSLSGSVPATFNIFAPSLERLNLASEQLSLLPPPPAE